MEVLNKLKIKLYSEELWASIREILNIFQTEKVGCQIITVPTVC